MNTWFVHNTTAGRTHKHGIRAASYSLMPRWIAAGRTFEARWEIAGSRTEMACGASFAR